MNYLILIQDGNGKTRLSKVVESGEVIPVQPGDEVFVMDEHGQPARASLKPAGSDLLIQFPEDGASVALGNYIASAGENTPVHVNLSSQSKAPDLKPQPDHEPSESPYPEPIEFAGGVANTPMGEEFTLMRYSNLFFRDFPDYVAGELEENSQYLNRDETPPPEPFGRGSSPPENQPPHAVDDFATVDEDEEATLAVVVNDIDPEGDPIAVTGVSQGAHGAVSINPDGTVSYTPEPNYQGTDSFTYTISDSHGGNSMATVFVNVQSINDAPVAMDDVYTTNEDGVLTGTLANSLLNNDSDVDGDPLTVNTSPVSGPSNGTLVLNSDGTFTYTPDPDFNGTDSFVYQVSDGQGGTDTATAVITINPVNDLPNATDDAASGNEDQAISGDLAVNDTLSGDGGNVFAKATDPSNGNVTVNPDGTFTYIPNANFNGTDSFTYRLTDANGDTSTATVQLTVNAVDDTPVAAPDTAAVNEDNTLTGNLASNDTLSGDGGNVFSKASDPANGTAVVNPDGTFSYTPNANFNGTDSFTYRLTDGDGDTSTSTVSITVNPVDDLPHAVNDSHAVNEDNSLSADLSVNDTLSGDGGNVFSEASGPANGTLTVNPDGTFTYVPNADFNGADTFSYRLTDADGDTSVATVNVTVNPVDDLPVAVDDSPAVNEDGILNGTLAGNDALSGDGGNVFSKLSDPANGTATVNPDGTFTYTPNANFNGTDSFTYRLTDIDGDTSVATVNITVNAVNDLPVANDDTRSVDEDSVLGGSVAGNDSLSGDGGNVFSKASDPSNGTVVVDPDGSFSYTPDANFNGTDSFTYRLADIDGDTSVATVNITVNSVDDTPLAVDDTPTVNEDNVLNGNLSANDTLSGDGGNVFSKASDPSNGTATVNPDGTYTYTPNPNFNGTDSFTYALTDADGDVTMATVHITVNPVDDSPQAVNDQVSVNEDAVLNGDVSSNDTLSGDGGNVFAKTSDPSNGTLVFNPDGTFTYTPNANFNGADSFTYRLTDVDGDTTVATVNVTVNSVDDLPFAVNDTVSVNEDVSLSGNLAANDTLSGDGGNIFGKVTDPANGVATVNPDGTFTYTPNANFNGTDSFTYRLFDADGDTSTATVQVVVQPVDDLPVASDDSRAVDENSVLNASVAGNDTLSGDGGNVFNKTTDPSNGSLIVNTDGTFTYTPNANFVGTDSFTYQLADADGDVSTATVTITVNPIDDAPVALDDTPSVNEDNTLNGNVAANDTLSADGGNTFTKLSDPTNGTLMMNPDGTFTYTPNANFFGTDSFTYQITDVDGDTSTATVNVTVNPVDDPPTAANDSGGTFEGNPVTVAVLNNDSDPDSDPLSVLSAGNGANGATTVNPDGTVTYTPNAGFVGTDTFSYTLSDGNGGTDTASVTVNVFAMPGNTEGVNGGHFDVDYDTELGGSTDGHVHAYDDKYDVDGVDFFNTLDGSISNVTDEISNGTRFKILVVNADLSPGVHIKVNGVSLNVTEYDDTPIEDLPVFSLDGVAGTTQLTDLQWDFLDTSIVGAGLLPSNTGEVKGNTPGAGGEWRNGALTLHLVEVNPDGTDNFGTNPAASSGGHGPATSGLLYESTVFWHWDGPSYDDNSPYVPGDPSSVEAFVEPVVIDFDRDGIVEFRSASLGAKLDVDGDGADEQVAWADRDDAVLIYDENGNQNVDGRSEFAFVDYKEGAQTDLEGLQAFDTDGDGHLSAGDAEFSKFALWQDANANGQVDEGEFFSLTDAGIKSIGLTSDGQSYWAADGDVQVHGESVVHYVDGSTSVAADASFRYYESGASLVEPEGWEAPLEVVGGDGQIVNLDAAQSPFSMSLPPAGMDSGQEITAVESPPPAVDDASVQAAAAAM